MAMAKRVSTVGVDDVVAAIETARDKVMSDEVKSLVKLGLPRNMAEQTVMGRLHLDSIGDEGNAGGGEFDQQQWQDLS